MSTLLGIFAKYPRPGTVKTRLARRIGAPAAAELYEAMLRDVVDRCATVGNRRVMAFACGAEDRSTATEYFRAIAPAYTLWEQIGTTLGARMRMFFDTHLGGTEGARRVVLIGSDAPWVTPALIEQAFARLQHRDCVIGPAADGGYYLIGLSTSCPEAFSDAIPWSGSRVLAATVEALQRNGRRLELLPLGFDVDTTESLDVLAGLIAAGRTAQRSPSSSERPGLSRTERWLRAHGFLG
ncbi:MAG: glycosyltransferase [Planctomycetota bacterium]|nr:MAG: glycosyltransferase [Planctomycetota bacterium]